MTIEDVKNFVMPYAISQMTKNGLAYHNSEHIITMLLAAKGLNYQFSKELLCAIYLHDVVYDDQPKKEERSAATVDNFPAHLDLGDRERIKELIRATEFHNFTGDRDKDRLILLDLFGFANESMRSSNRQKVLTECLALYPTLRRQELLILNAMFLGGLELRLRHTLDFVELESDVALAVKIINGIKATIRENEDEMESSDEDEV